MSPLRFGVLGTAKIAREKVIPALQKGEHTTVTALASRSLDRAESMADALNLPDAFGSYEALLEEADVDAVYIPLPNHQHVEWAERALAAGKHVLCEKPIGLDADEARRLDEAARAHPRLKVMEAFMYRFHPQWAKAKALIDDGVLGPLRCVEAAFSYYKTDPDDIRNKPELGGGGLMDVGCYCISAARHVYGQAPERVMGQIDRDPDLGVDRRTSALMDFGDAVATFTCATQMAAHQRVTVFGERGKLELPVPFTPAPDETARLLLTTDDEAEEITLDPVDQYTLQGDAFAQAVLDDTPVPTPLDDAVENMRVLEAVRRSADEGVWIAC